MPYTLGSLLHPADRAKVLSRFVHRYTVDHVPAWANMPAPNGRFCAPLYASDDEWLSSTVFRVRKSDRRLDERTAALAGLVIDGIPITDHCSRYGAPKGPDLGRFPIGYKAPAGYHLANWFRVGTERLAHRGAGLPEGWEGYADCYRTSGLDVLRAFGYRVIEVL